MENGFYINGYASKDIYVYSWNDCCKPRAVIQVFHGMAEHAGRYGRFASYMNSKGFAVYANDHRGHGKTAGKLEEVGYIGEDGFNRIVEDEYIITKKIKEIHPDIPIIILGHSFGSFVAQEYIIKYGESISGTILSGSSMTKGSEVAVGKIIAAISRNVFGDRKKAYLLNKLSFGSYNKMIKNPVSPFSWLSRDEAEVKKYDEDPYCGKVFTAGFYYYFFEGLAKLYCDERLGSIPYELPLLIISGDQDPVGKYGSGVKKLYENYKSIGMRNIEIKLYQGARHEILNEINRDEVMEDISAWINR
ncbi:MAG TPA: lysophospholipase [Clostridiales bacterium]|nr:lysophospholipase [Clostridiales bacterium]